MSSDPVTPIESMIDAVLQPIPHAPGENPDGLPYATHEGVLKIGELSLRCYQLNTGQRVFDADDVRQFIEGIEDHTDA